MSFVKQCETGRIFAIENTLNRRNLKNVKSVEIGGEICLEANWTDDAANKFCAEFGVSAHKGRDAWIFANLHQPYQPQTRF